MNPDSYDARRLLDQLETQISRAQENATAVAAVAGWGEAANGQVKVCVGPSGVLKKVELDPRAMRMASEDLAASIVEAARGAQRRTPAALTSRPSPRASTTPRRISSRGWRRRGRRCVRPSSDRSGACPLGVAALDAELVAFGVRHDHPPEPLRGAVVRDDTRP